MKGEVHDYNHPLDKPISDKHDIATGLILQIALAWVLVYYFVIIPLNIIPENESSMIEYDDGQLKPRIPYFKYFRQYENLHMLFWIAKDLAWNKNNLELWLIFLVPTLLMAGDMLLISLYVDSEVS
jgi:hypothetical protein